MRRKSAVYSWRVAPALKEGLESAARSERRSLAQLLDEIAAGYLARRGDDDLEGQRRLRARARRFAGILQGSDPGRSTRVRSLVRGRLRRRRRAR